VFTREEVHKAPEKTLAVVIDFEGLAEVFNFNHFNVLCFDNAVHPIARTAS